MVAERCYTVSPATVFARPTADQIWLGPSQQAALSRLRGPQDTRLLVGPKSSGKTTLLIHVAHAIDAGCSVLSCRGPQHSAAGLLSALLQSAGLAPWELSAIDQRNLLTVFIQQRHSQGRRVVITVDDAHTITGEAWDEIERLRWQRTGARAVVDLMLAGPTVLTERLTAQRGETEQQRPMVHVLEPPAPHEIESYIDWRLARFDLGGVITPVATRLIARLSAGRFNFADVLCQMSLLLLRRDRLERIDAHVVRRAVAALAARKDAKLESVESPQPSRACRNADMPSGHLLISRDGKMLKRVALSERMLLGRSQHNDVCLPSPYLGRHHAVIVGTPDGYYVVDLNSVNGLKLNGQRIMRAILCDQDVLSIGPYRVKVQLPDWIRQGDPLPEADSLADTDVMPALAPQLPAIVRIK